MDTSIIREQVEGHMTPEAPLARALTASADALDALARGLAATVERLERLEGEVLPRDPQDGLGSGSPAASGRTV